jgi:hypothetical protein
MSSAGTRVWAEGLSAMRAYEIGSTRGKPEPDLDYL